MAAVATVQVLATAFSSLRLDCSPPRTCGRALQQLTTCRAGSSYRAGIRHGGDEHDPSRCCGAERVGKGGEDVVERATDQCGHGPRLDLEPMRRYCSQGLVDLGPEALHTQGIEGELAAHFHRYLPLMAMVKTWKPPARGANRPIAPRAYPSASRTGDPAQLADSRRWVGLQLHGASRVPGSSWHLRAMSAFRCLFGAVPRRCLGATVQSRAPPHRGSPARWAEAHGTRAKGKKGQRDRVALWPFLGYDTRQNNRAGLLAVACRAQASGGSTRRRRLLGRCRVSPETRRAKKGPQLGQPVLDPPGLHLVQRHAADRSADQPQGQGKVRPLRCCACVDDRNSHRSASYCHDDPVQGSLHQAPVVVKLGEYRYPGDDDRHGESDPTFSGVAEGQALHYDETP